MMQPTGILLNVAGLDTVSICSVYDELILRPTVCRLYCSANENLVLLSAYHVMGCRVLIDVCDQYGSK